MSENKMPKYLGWWEAEELRKAGVRIEYRDGGAYHREIEWHEVDGELTKHMSDFDFRIVNHPQHRE